MILRYSMIKMPAFVLVACALSGCSQNPRLDLPVPIVQSGDIATCMTDYSRQTRVRFLGDLLEPLQEGGLSRPLDWNKLDFLTTRSFLLPVMQNMQYEFRSQSAAFDPGKMQEIGEKLSDSFGHAIWMDPGALQRIGRAGQQAFPDKVETQLKFIEGYFNAYFGASEEGFISRAGTRLKFPGLTGPGLAGISAKPSDGRTEGASVDFSQVGTDIVRVAMEAIRDASRSKYELPAVAQATGVKLGLTAFKPKDNKWNNLDEAGFLAINAKANRAESMIGTAVGKAIRGGFITGLNNEALAKMTETVAGIIARNVTEDVELCKAKTSNSTISSMQK